LAEGGKKLRFYVSSLGEKGKRGITMPSKNVGDKGGMGTESRGVP